MPSPLAVLAAQETARYQAATTAALSALASRQTVQSAAEALVASLAAALADFNEQIAEVRADLAAVATPADAEPLLSSLAALLADLHNAQGQMVSAQQALAVARARTARASAELARAQQRLEAATAAQARYEALDEEHGVWVTALGQPPLDTLKADATNALTVAPFTDAVGRVDANVPAELLARARERAAAQQLRVTGARTSAAQAEDRMKQEQADSEGASGDVEKKALALERAVAALRDYVTSARDRFDRAQTLSLGVMSSPELTAEQVARVNDATLKTPGIAAATAEKERDVAAATKAEKQALYDDAVLVRLIADPDADPVLHADVIAAQGVLTGAIDALALKEAAYVPLRSDLDHWEAALPDTMWRQVAAVEEARALLTRLSTLDPSSLPTAVTAAETALATSLGKAAVRGRAATILIDTVTERSAGLEAVLSAQQDAAFSATRGDQ
jgi:hypothetical protein